MVLALILAVGRDPIVLESRAAVLRSAGHIVETANCVSDAVSRFRHGDFDAVILCHSSPRTERDRLTSIIRASGSRVPILLISPGSEPSGLADRVIDSHPKRLLQGIEAALKRAGTLYPAKAAGSAVNFENGKGRFTVLCIDDEPNSLYIRRLVLEKAGYNVLTSDNCDYSLSIISTGIVDAVILDYLMPDMNGAEVAAQIRKIRKDIPLILHSGIPNLPEDVVARFDASIPKGASPQALIAALHQTLSDPGKKKPPAQESTEDYFKYGTFH